MRPWLVAALGLTLLLALPTRADGQRRGASAPPPEPAPAIAAPRVVGRHETQFDPTDTARATNVQLAASLLDGAIIAPHRQLSFDERIGPRTRERGFEDAETLLGGIPTPGIGGGICQVATTLFVAAFTAGLPIPAVRSHSRLPHYAEPGMDAVIAAHQSDLVIGNPFSVPVTVSARATDGRLVIELIAAAEPLVVTWDAHVERTTPIREHLERDRHAPPGTRVLVDEGAEGRTVTRTRTVRQGDRVRRERTQVRYPSFRRVVRVGAARAVP